MKWKCCMEKNKEKERENSKRRISDLIIKIVLIIIIILLLIHNCALIKKQNEYANSPVPSGNVEIIEIKCDDNRCVTPRPTDDNTSPAFNEQGEIEVFDNEKTPVQWNGATDLKIFSNSIYAIPDIIAPESSNTYQFIVRNSTKYKIKYNINFVENNPYHINMKYKLKKNDTYVIDHYVSASELKAANYLLNSNQNDTYYLEWKWISSSNDTEIGHTPNANYRLSIEVKAESING